MQDANQLTYDVLILGGSIAGATVAKRLAAQGLRILLVERELHFSDRVRGEGMLPWGVAEAQQLGIYDLLCGSCAQPIYWWNQYGSTRESTVQRDLVATTRHRLPVLTFYHPELQEVLLSAAQRAGAELWRGANALALTTGVVPQVTVAYRGKVIPIRARLVVVAVGRHSALPLPPKLASQAAPSQLTIAGLLFRDLAAPRDAVSLFASSRLPGQLAIFFPLSKRRHRVYFIYPTPNRPQKLSGHRQIPLFLDACQELGVPPAWFAAGVTAGPLAAYLAAARWVQHPYHAGVVLVGDAAGAPNPCFGCGLSLALRDARVLTDQLLTEPDWELASNAYAHHHADYFGRLHRKETWFSTLFFSQGPEANQRRAYARGLHSKEPDRDLDLIGLGPDERYDEWARMRFFGEDLAQTVGQ